MNCEHWNKALWLEVAKDIEDIKTKLNPCEIVCECGFRFNNPIWLAHRANQEGLKGIAYTIEDMKED